MAEGARFSLISALRRTGAVAARIAPTSLVWAIPLVVLPYLVAADLIATMRFKWTPLSVELALAIFWTAFQIVVIWLSAEVLSGRRASFSGAVQTLRATWLAALVMEFLYGALAGMAGALQTFVSFVFHGPSVSFDALEWLAGAPIIGVNAVWIMVLPARVVQGPVIFQALQRSWRLFKTAPVSLLLLAVAQYGLRILIGAAANEANAAWSSPWHASLYGLSDLLGVIMAVAGTVVYLELKALHPRHSRAVGPAAIATS